MRSATRSNGDPCDLEGFGSRGRIPVRETRRCPVFVCERLRNAALECGRGRCGGGMAFALGNGGGLLCVVLGWLGGAVAHYWERPGRPTGPWKGGWNGHLVPPGFPSAGSFRYNPVSAGSSQARRRGRGGRVSGVESFVTQKIQGGGGKGRE